MIYIAIGWSLLAVGEIWLTHWLFRRRWLFCVICHQPLDVSPWLTICPLCLLQPDNPTRTQPSRT